MDMNVCAVCGKPIMGYFYELSNKTLVCEECGAINTLSNLYNQGVISVKPEIIEITTTGKTADNSTEEKLDAVYDELHE